MTVWHNGCFNESGEITLSALDSAFSGMGAFETLLACDGRVFSWSAHEERLRHSLAVLSIEAPDLTEIREVFMMLLSRNGLESGEARLRVVVSGAQGRAGNVIVMAAPYERPAVALTLATSTNVIYERSPLRQVKTLSYAENWLFHYEAAALEVDDVLVANTAGNIAEASMSNVIVRHEGRLKTPPVQAGCLPGVTRALLLKMSSEIRVEEIPISELAEAEEIWLCNSLRRLQYATSLDGRGLAAPSCHFFDLSEALEIMIANGAP